jgi:tetratricopeptide (TPR) repeat protein
LHGIERGDYRYIAAPGAELYDLKVDSGETANRLGDLPEQAARLAGELRAAVDLEVATAAPRVAEAALDDEAEAKLRSLGYLSSAAPPPAAPVDPKTRIAVWESLQRALALYGRGQFASAARAFESVLRTERQMPIAYGYLGATYMRLERWEEAERVYAEALRRGIETPALRIDLGRIHQHRENAARAEAEWLRTLELDPANVSALFHLGDLYRAGGRGEDAAAMFRAALAVSPGHVYSWNGLGTVLSGVDSDEALAAFGRAVELAPEEPRGVLNLAIQLERLGRRGEARLAYARCLALLGSAGEPNAVRELAAAGLERLGGS